MYLLDKCFCIERLIYRQLDIYRSLYVKHAIINPPLAESNICKDVSKLISPTAGVLVRKLIYCDHFLVLLPQLPTSCLELLFCLSVVPSHCPQIYRYVVKAIISGIGGFTVMCKIGVVFCQKRIRLLEATAIQQNKVGCSSIPLFCIQFYVAFLAGIPNNSVNNMAMHSFIVFSSSPKGEI